jgi:hypothetical protein
MELNAESLNQLLTLLGEKALDTEQLTALKTSALKPFYNEEARMRGVFKGRSADTVALWAYPDVNIHKISLLKAEKMNTMGQITAFSREVVLFPKITAIHFIGTKSER